MSAPLEAVLKPWFEAGGNFVLEKDSDSGHGAGKSNIVQNERAEHGLKYSHCFHFL